MKKTVFLLLFFSVGCLPAFGWGQKGHDVIASIAEAHLTRRAKKAIDSILEGRSMVYYSSWMDNLQNSPGWKGGYDVTKTWHYANVDEGYTYETMRKEPAGDVLTAMEMVISALKSGELSDSLRSDYLKMLVHMVGDMHCPMHAGRLSDRGGNNVPVRWFGTPTNLHSVWDTEFIESARKWSHTEWREQLDRCGKKEIKAVTAGSVYDWFEETVVAAAVICENTTEGADLRYQYVYDFNGLLERQLLYAGYRLAAVLNDIFG